MNRSCIVLAFFLTALPAIAADLGLEKRVIEHTAPNGIKLLVLERHFSPTVSIRMMFRTGSVDETEGKTGLAHMFEHMMFKGTRTLGTKNYAKEAPLLAQIDALHQRIDKEKARGAKADQALIGHLIEQLHQVENQAQALTSPNELWNLYEREGASNVNAGTAPDFTQYVLDLPSNKLQLWAIIDSERVKNPVFREFYSERDVVKEERRMRVDTNPDGKLYENFLATAYTKHPYRHPTIGWAVDLDSLNVADLEAFYRKHYTPDRLTIAVVGDVHAQKVIALVDSYFGNWRPSAVHPNDPADEPPQKAQHRATVETDAETHLMMGFHLPRYPDPDHFVFAALASLLGDGQSSRLYHTLVEDKHLATSVDTDPSTPGERYDSLFVISASPRFPHTPEEVEKAIEVELENLKTKPIEAWELEKARARTETDILSALQTNAGMASVLAYDQSLFGDWRYLLRYQKAIGSLTAQDIQRAAQRIFRTENSTVVFRTRKKAEKK